MSGTLELSNILAEHAAEIRRLGKRVVADVVEIGRHLSECKAICGHGNWLPWLEREFGWTDDTALARNLWTSLLARGGELDLDVVLARHQAWLDTGPPDVGNQTRAARLEARRGTPQRRDRGV